jgi:enolase
VFKYFLISSTKEGLSLISTVINNIKKTITSGKGGEAALKYSPDGTFICPLDTIMDNLKIVEDAINNTPGG